MNACRFSTIFAAALLSAAISANAQTFEVGLGAASVLSEELLDERQEHLSLTAGILWRIGR